MHTQTYYTWKECHDNLDGTRHFVTPWSDPMVYEYAMDFCFETEQKAIDFVQDQEIDVESEGWVLVKVYIEELDMPSFEDLPD